MENINSTLEEYFQALERLIKNRPMNVPMNSKINKDTVALEAGRKRGSIKKSREVFLELIEAIDSASANIESPQKEIEDKLHKHKEQRDKYKSLYEEALNREIMYLDRINKLEKMLSKKSPFSLNDENYGLNKVD